MKISNVIEHLEMLAPLQLQEDYDNSGLLTGNAEVEFTGVLLTLDVTEAVIEEAIKKDCNMIVAHHPIIFKGIKKLTGDDMTERVLIKAVKSDLAIYAIHTNLDNVSAGVNYQLAAAIGLKSTEVLMPKLELLRKLTVMVPTNEVNQVRDALFSAGAGSIGNYDGCSFSMVGKGTFRPLQGANPVKGFIGQRESVNETMLEVVFEHWKLRNVLVAMRAAHPYEEIAHQVYGLANSLSGFGSGLIGRLDEPMVVVEFLSHLKKVLKARCIRHTSLCYDKVQTVAVCGGSGGFALKTAMARGAEVLVSSDFTYHKFFDADGRIIIADPGHFETEQFTPLLLLNYLKQKMPTFALRLSETDTNPINYF